MRKTWVGRSECRGTAVHYYLVAEERAGVERYGLQVCCGEEVETVRDITVSRRGIRSLLDAMIRGGVTPVTVREVVEDWLNMRDANDTVAICKNGGSGPIPDQGMARSADKAF